MPVVKIRNDNGDVVEAYATSGSRWDPHHVGIVGHAGQLARISAVRREYAGLESESLSLKKTAPASDGRWFKDEIRRFQRMQRAATIWMEWFTTSKERVRNFPIGLAAELDFVLAVAATE